MHHGPLIAIIVAGLGLAFVFGAVAQKLRISPLVGYLVAGVAVGPFTPGFVADQNLANELAEIGVILLMFGVGLHFSLKDLLSVKAIAVPGAVVQIGIATLLGLGLGTLLGWNWFSGAVFGLALSTASTVVLLRALQERRLVQTERGRIAVGWLIVEDMAMVLALVLLPVLAEIINGGSQPGASAPLATRFDLGIWGVLGLTFAKLIGFLAFMLVVGRRVIPWVLHWVAHTGSRELFRLAVLAVALGVAYLAATLFGVSFALGAFFAGMILSESPLSQRAAEETLPLRDAFAVLFFVSVGMLFDPGIILRAPGPLIATLAIILIGKSVAAWMIVRAFGRSNAVALTISASLAQIGEFSFILAGLGSALGILPAQGRDLILAGAILSILFNPVMFAIVERLAPEAPVAKPKPAAAPAETAEPEPTASEAQPEATPERDVTPTSLKDHIVVVGYGRVGSLLGAGLLAQGSKLLVIEDNPDAVATAKRDGAELLVGNAADPEVLSAAAVGRAIRLFVAIPGSFEAGQVCEQARAENPTLPIVARAHSDAEVAHLTKCGATLTIMGEAEIARAMLGLCQNLAGAAQPEASPPEAKPEDARPDAAGGLHLVKPRASASDDSPADPSAAA